MLTTISIILIEEWIQLWGEKSVLEADGNNPLTVVEQARVFSMYESAMNANPSA
jgi:hypothetical protein